MQLQRVLENGIYNRRPALPESMKPAGHVVRDPSAVAGRRKIAAYSWQVRLEGQLDNLTRRVDIHNTNFFGVE